MSTENDKNMAKDLKDKAEARSEKIEGQIREAIGKMDNSPEDVAEGQELQERAKDKTE